MGKVNVAFKELVHKFIDRIKNELFFRWPNKMGGTPLGETKTCTVLTTRIIGIQLSNARC